MTPEGLTMAVILGATLLVTLVSTVIVATTRAAVSELKAELIEKLASKDQVTELEARIRTLEART